MALKVAQMTGIGKIMTNRTSYRHSLTNTMLVVLVYDGLCAFEFGTAVEAFSADPELTDAQYEMVLAGVDGEQVKAENGLTFSVDCGLDVLEEAGTIVIPGWRGVNEPVPDRLIEALHRANLRGCRLVSICTGSFVLAAAGLLSGKRATTHWRHAPALAAAYPDILVEPSVLYVDEGSILTSAGCAAGIDLCLHLIRRDFGPEAANHVARRMVIPSHREGGQAQFIARPVPVRQGATLAPLLDLLRSRLNENFSIEELAREACMSRRTFLRRFHDATGKSPGNWLRELRLEHARSLLETTNLSMEALSESCGFGSVESFRLHFRSQFGIAPTTYRRQFTS